MVKFIQQLEESDFLNLLVAIKQMRYGDNSRLYEYWDKEDKRIIHLWDNEGSFKDNGEDYIWINDYETSNPDCNIYHNTSMLYRFGQEWYESAEKYFKDKKMTNSLKILKKAKAQYERELGADREFMQSLDDEEGLSK